MLRFFPVFFLLLPICALAQKSTPIEKDTVRTLNEVIVQAYAADRPQLEVPTSIGVIKEHELNRFGNTSLLPAVNTVPGVRMEERSPGSYRFSIRGSTLRSPFGVRNVKFYWNGLPLTDGGGNTYLNLLDFNSVGSLEIIKGPGASLYGAGTGGVVLLQSPRIASSDLHFSALGGSYGQMRLQGGATLINSKNFHMDFGLGYQAADGYRQQTKMNRVIAQVNWQNTLGNKSSLTGTVFSSQLYYQTPGGLTQVQYEADPQQARPATTFSPSAVDQQAAVTNKTTYGGVVFEHLWSNQWSSHIGVFGSITDFKNPAIRNYEIRNEENWGGRMDTQYGFKSRGWKGKLTIGAEYQHFFSPDAVYDNLQGTPGNLQVNDQLQSQLLLAFAQVELDLPKEFYVTVGGSGNVIQYDFLRTSVTPEVRQTRNFAPVFSPRIALLKKLSSTMSAYGSISNGFSQPSLAEVRPSTGTFNNTLNPEQGTSYELGVKGKVFNLLDVNMALYNLVLRDAIVILRDPSGADYFINAGGTSQKGVELLINWSSLYSTGAIGSVRVWTSYTYNYYRFTDYVNIGVDYSGNALTGVPATVLVAGVDLRLRNGLYMNLTTNYTDRLPLNDGNTAYTSDYFILGTRIGYHLAKKSTTDFFLGVDNAFGEKYSLGNDLNATGGRYFNTAPGRNFYFGVSTRFLSGSK